MGSNPVGNSDFFKVSIACNSTTHAVCEYNLYKEIAKLFLTLIFFSFSYSVFFSKPIQKQKAGQNHHAKNRNQNGTVFARGMSD